MENHRRVLVHVGERESELSAQSRSASEKSSVRLLDLLEQSPGR
jgi:hypothetical protein